MPRSIELSDLRGDDTDSPSGNGTHWTGKPHVFGSSETLKMGLLTVSVAGLQLAWSVEMSYVNVYLLSLGMSKSHLSVIWVAGPLSGLIMQPIIGVISDNTTSKYGRRRPYILVGSILVTLGLVVMAWARDIVDIFPFSEATASAFTIMLAVFGVLITDFAINAVQACCRAIIVDTLPSDKQETGNAWAGRMIAIGHLLGYFAGYLDLLSIFHGKLGNTQLKSFCVVSSLALLLTASTTCLAVSERVLTSTNTHRGGILQEILGVFTTLTSTVSALPKRISLIFKIQLCAWYGWFSFLFYSSTWVSEVYVKYDLPQEKQGSQSDDKVGDLARVGSRSLMAFSIVSLVCSLLLPELIKKPKDPRSHQRRGRLNTVKFVLRKFKLAFNQIFSPMTRYLRMPMDANGSQSFTLTDLWLVSHVVYAISAFLSGFVKSVTQATLVVALCGFSWAITTWAPFALLAEEILLLNHQDTYELNDIEESIDIAQPQTSISRPDSRLAFSSAASTPIRGSFESNMTPTTTEEYGDVATTGEKSGVYLGIHNVAITIPQLISTLGSFIIFSAFQVSTNQDEESLPSKPGEGDGGRAIAFTMQVGSIAAIMGAILTWKLKTTMNYTPV